jgi:quercetin dioxygenase-like cupin family protein
VLKEEVEVETKILDAGSFDLAEFGAELAEAPGNLEVGTALLFENDHIKVWEVRLQPGERGAFHAHTRRYFWTVVEGGIGRQRSADGSYRVREYRTGETSYQEHGPGNVMIHDFENAGDGEIRFLTVELLD